MINDISIVALVKIDGLQYVYIGLYVINYEETQDEGESRSTRHTLSARHMERGSSNAYLYEE